MLNPSHHTRRIWDEDEQIWTDQPLRKSVFMKYSDVIEKILMNFRFDVSQTVGCILDPSAPIRINDKNVEIPDMPADRNRLKKIERSDIDVTKFLRTGSKGEYNLVEVKYLLKDKSWFKKQIGTLTLDIEVYLSREIKDSTPVSEPSIFCMNCGCSVRFSDFKYCPYCAGPRLRGGLNPKPCPNPNCNEIIPETAKFCQKCGHEQAV